MFTVRRRCVDQGLLAPAVSCVTASLGLGVPTPSFQDRACVPQLLSLLSTVIRPEPWGAAVRRGGWNTPSHAD